MEHLFDEILEKDEKVIKVFKPHKGRYLKSFYWAFAIPIFWPHLILFIVGSFFTIPFLLVKGYNNVYYAYTNKRLIVRHGTFGNSYESLEYKDVTSTSVDVGFLDRKSKTGSITFVSPSSHHEHEIEFSNVVNPYQVLNEIKEYMNTLNK